MKKIVGHFKASKTFTTSNSKFVFLKKNPKNSKMWKQDPQDIPPKFAQKLVFL